MHLNYEKDEVYCHHCLTWHSIDTDTLWLAKDNGEIDIVCLKAYPDHFVHLGFDKDLE
jgi:hypothetical protein